MHCSVLIRRRSCGRRLPRSTGATTATILVILLVGKSVDGVDCKKTLFLFELCLYICPEPVLVNMIILVYKLAQKMRFLVPEAVR
jgi:hypothetical protein